MNARNLAAEAADWIVRLSADDPSERAHAQREFAAWKARDPRHAEAAAGMEGLLGRVERLRAVDQGGVSRQALARARPARRWSKAGAALAIALCCLLAGVSTFHGELREAGAVYLLGDLRTRTGEWQAQTLADGSRIELGSQSAVHLDFSDTLRRVELLRGEIFVSVAPDAARPFVVDAEHGRIRALGTRFRVRDEGDTTLLTMLESKVAVQTAAGEAQQAPTTTVQAGQRVRLDAAGLQWLAPVDPLSDELAWQKRLYVAQGLPLPEVLDELDRHFHGRILFDRAALAGYRVSAVLPLADGERAAQLLVANFPQLRLRRVAPYLLRVEAAGG